MTDVDFRALGYQAYQNDEPAAPWLNPTVQNAVAGMPVGGGGVEIMRAFQAGYSAAADEAARAAVPEAYLDIT